MKTKTEDILKEKNMELFYLEEFINKLNKKDSKSWTGEEHRDYVTAKRRIEDIHRDLKKYRMNGYDI